MLKDSAGALADRANLGLLFPEHRVYFHGAPALTVPADLYCIIAKVFLLLHSASVLLFLFRFDVERLILLYDYAALLHDLLAGIVLTIGQQLILGRLLHSSDIVLSEALEQFQHGSPCETFLCGQLRRACTESDYSMHGFQALSLAEKHLLVLGSIRLYDLERLGPGFLQLCEPVSVFLTDSYVIIA